MGEVFSTPHEEWLANTDGSSARGSCIFYSYRVEPAPRNANCLEREYKARVNHPPERVSYCKACQDKKKKKKKKN